MKIQQIFLIFISVIKSLNCERVVDVKVLDSNKNALNIEQIENARLLTVEFWSGGEAMYSFDLRREISIVSPDFEAYEQDKDANLVRIEDENLKKNCYFSGTVEGFQESMAAMSFCQGIMGHFIAGGNSYKVNEVMIDSTPSFSQATLHKQEASNLTFACGVKRKQKDKMRAKRSVAEMGNEVKVIELYLIANNDVFKSFGDVAKTMKQINTLVLMANLYYRQINFFLVAKKIEIWSVSDNFVTSSLGDGEDILERFISYKQQKFNDVDHDAAFLFITKLPENDLGLAVQDQICNLDANTGWVRLDSLNDNIVNAMVFAHELGHLIGADHDDECTPRPPVDSIMKERHAPIAGFMYVWSECSLKEIRDVYDGPRTFCLLPKQEYSTGVCGDGIVNTGEECDNFGMLDRAQKKCCDPRTCKLIGNAKCWKGLCCDVNTCQFKGAGTVCRHKDGVCDEDDVCNGTSSSCRNRFKRNGQECLRQAFCFKGKCQSRSKACENLHGTPNAQSPDSCYTEDHRWIPQLLIYMNCGIDSNKSPIACERRDRKCGKLMCYSQASPCKLLVSHEHISYRDISPKYVPEGSYCGENMFCINRKCINRPLYMIKEFEKYGDAQYSYDDQEVDGDFNYAVSVKSDGSSQDLSSLLCAFLTINLLLSFSC